MLTNITFGLVRVSDFLALVLFSVFILLDNFKIKLNSLETFYLKLLFLMSVVSLLFTITTQSEHLNEFLRSSRVIIYFYITVILINHNKDMFIRWTLILILLHALLCVIGAFNQTVFSVLAEFTGYEKQWFLGRGNGLGASFDTAGFVIIAGIILLSLRYSKINLVLALFLLASGFFTGRTFMVLGPLIFFIFFIVRKTTCIKAAVSIPIFTLIALVVVLLQIDFSMLVSFVKTLGTGDGYWGSTDKLINWAYQTENYATWFGTGQLADMDIGYSKAWYFGGIFYLLFQSLVVVMLPILYFKKNISIEIITILALILVYNFKIYTFLAGIFMPLYIAIILLIYRVASEEHVNEGS